MAKGESNPVEGSSSWIATPKKTDGASAKKIPVVSNSLSSSSPSSLVNTLLSLSILVGVGAIVGYIVFSSIYNHRCSDLMDDAERRFNQTREDLNHKLVEAMHQNTANEGAESELLELRGRLEGQTDLMGKHEALLDKHQSTVERLNQLQAKQDKASLQSSQLERELQTSQKKVSELEGKLNVASVQKEASEKRLQQANARVETLLEQAKAPGDSSACEAKQQQSMSHIQAIHSAICKEKYGESPYYIQFDIEIEGDKDEATLFFVVEIETLDELPHSVFTFLTLVENDVYKDAEFLSTQSIIHLDSDEDKVASLGYATSALSLVEGASLGACTPYSVGFVGANGGLKIIMTSDATKHGSLACFGSIAQGRQTVTRIQRAGREGKTVSITGTKAVKLTTKPTLGEGEF